MNDLAFLSASDPLTLAAVAAESGAHLPGDADPSRIFRAAAPLARAGRSDVSAFYDGSSLDDLRATRAGACLVAPHYVGTVPRGTVPLVTDHPRNAFRRLTMMLHPESIRPVSAVANRGIDPGARVHAGALLERGVVIDPGAIIGPGAEIGSGTFIGAQVVVGAGVRIGRDCAIDTQANLRYALIGDRVVIHAGVRIGHGGRDLHLGRVIIQNDVEIGANATIERGTFADTVIGEGCWIGPLTCIAADVVTPLGARLTGWSSPSAADRSAIDAVSPPLGIL